VVSRASEPREVAVEGGSSSALLEVRHVRKTYTDRNRSIEAIGDLDFTVGRGEFVSVVGPSGAGKTTLLRCIAGLLPATSGEIRLAGQVVTAPPKDLAVVFQEYGRSLFPWMTVRENVDLPLREKRLGADERHELVEDAIRAVGLGHAGDAYPWQLSGGMQQRVAIARAVAYRPAVLLMDEPFAAVDAQTRAELEDLVRSLWAQFGMTIIFVTHDIDESVYLSERVLVLSRSPTRIIDEVAIDLPSERDQLQTRSEARFAELRARVYARIQEAKSADPIASPTTGTPSTS